MAIDGPSASGKSTVARNVATAMGFVFVDSGSLYRSVTWRCLEDGIDPGRPAEVVALLDRMRVDSRLEQGAVRFLLDGVDPGDAIRSEPVVERVSDIAAIPEVRRYVVEALRETQRFGDLVMEGRDIGTVVFPGSPHKFYIDASPEERARRRHKEIVAAQPDGVLDEVMDSLKRRDHKDTTRKTAPLQIADGATVLDTTHMGIDQVVAMIVKHLDRTRSTN